MSPLLPTDLQPATRNPHRVALFSFLGTPVYWCGARSLPVIVPGLWAAITWLVGKRQPAHPWPARVAIGAAGAVVAAGIAWGHSFAHAFCARLVGAPMDEMVVLGGIPRIVYFTNDLRVLPWKHFFRALGGPVWNLKGLIFSLWLRSKARPGSAARELAGVAAAVNASNLIGLLPYPGLDGGALLKWGLVLRGRTPQEADAIVQQADLAAGGVLAVGGLRLLRERRPLAGALALGFGAIGLLLGLGVLRED